MAQQLAVLLVGETIGVVVGGQDDHRVVQLARRVQLVHQALHRQLQLLLAGQIALDAVAVGQVLHLVPVLPGHGVLLQVIVQVAAHREAIDHERVLVHKHGHDLLHHLLVRGREGVGGVQGQPLPQGDILIAHVGVGPVPVIVVIEIVVESHGAIAQVPELVAQGEGHIVFRGERVAPHPRLGHQAGSGDIFPV